MSEPTLNTGDHVTVFAHPVYSEESREGVARLEVKSVDPQVEGYERWWVRFFTATHGYEGITCLRIVHARNLAVSYPVFARLETENRRMRDLLSQMTGAATAGRVHVHGDEEGDAFASALRDAVRFLSSTKD